MYVYPHPCQDVFDHRDVQRLMTDDFYVHRFYMHHYETAGDQMENAIQMIVSTFKYRKQIGLRDLKAEDMNDELKERGELFIHGHDKDGCPLLVFRVKNHYKAKHLVEPGHKYFMYHTERVEREEPNKKMTLVMDCASSGVKNIDMDAMQFMIGAFKEYLPWSLNYILVFEMPWIMNSKHPP